MFERKKAALRVLVVEDDDLTRAALSLGLRHQGMLVQETGDASGCLTKLEEGGEFDAAVLDLGLPDQDGIDLVGELHRWPRLGLIVVTRRSAIEARIEALDIGADDYLIKPVDYAELAARVRSVVRRRRGPVRRWRQLGPWLIDLDARTVTTEGRSAGLTRGEFDILSRLVEAEGRVVNRDHLLDVISRNPQDSDPRSVDMLVSRLRRKLGGPGEGAFIATSAGHGYRLSENPEAI